jgi:hypothetical protein
MADNKEIKIKTEEYNKEKGEYNFTVFYNNEKIKSIVKLGITISDFNFYFLGKNYDTDQFKGSMKIFVSHKDPKIIEIIKHITHQYFFDTNFQNKQEILDYLDDNTIKWKTDYKFIKEESENEESESEDEDDGCSEEFQTFDCIQNSADNGDPCKFHGPFEDDEEHKEAVNEFAKLIPLMEKNTVKKEKNKKCQKCNGLGSIQCLVNNIDGKEIQETRKCNICYGNKLCVDCHEPVGKYECEGGYCSSCDPLEYED